MCRQANIPKPKKLDVMAKLFELCSDVPQKIVMVQRANVVAGRMAAVYDRRMSYLDTEQAIFEQCKRNRSKKRVHNTFSTEEAGRGGASCIHENRFRGSYIHVVSKSRIK